MIFNVKRKELLLQVERVARAASGTHPNKVLSGIHMEACSRTNVVRLTATNLEVAIKTSVPAAVEQDGCAVIEAGLLIGMLEKLPEDDVYFGTDGDSKITVFSGNAKYQVVTFPTAEFPKVEIPMPGETVAVSGLKTLIRKTAFAAGKLDGRAVTHCVHLVLTRDGLTATASNGFLMAQTAGDRDCKGQTSLLVPASSLKLFAAIASDSDVYEMGIAGENGKSVVFFDGTLLFSARLVDGSYMDSDKMFASLSAASSATLDAGYLRNMLSGIRTTNPGEVIGITFSDTGLLLTCEGKKANGTAMVSASVTKPNGKCYYNTDSLSECLRALSGAITLSLSPQGHLLLNDARTRCLLLATRAPSAEEEPVKKASATKTKTAKAAAKKAA